MFVLAGTPLVTQWSKGSRRADGSMEIVHLHAVVTKTSTSTAPVEIHQDTGTLSSFNTVPNAALDQITIPAYLQVVTETATVNINLFKGLDLSTLTVGPVFLEVTGSGHHALLGVYRFRWRAYRQDLANELDLRWSTGSVNYVGGVNTIPKPDIRFPSLRLISQAGWTWRSRFLWPQATNVNPHTWQLASGKSILLQLNDLRLSMTLVSDKALCMSADRLNEDNGVCMIVGQYGIRTMGSPLTAMHFPLPAMTAEPFKSALTSLLQQEQSAYGKFLAGEFPGAVVGPFMLQGVPYGGQTGGDQIHYPGFSHTVIDKGNTFRWLKIMRHYLGAQSNRRQFQLYDIQGRPLNPDILATTPGGAMPFNFEVTNQQPRYAPGWLHGSKLGFDTVPVLTAADAGAVSYETTLLSYDPYDHQHIYRGLDECTWLASIVGDWHAIDWLQARAMVDMLSWYDGSGGEFNASLGWILAKAQATPNQGGYANREVSEIAAVVVEAYRYAWTSADRVTMKRWLERFALCMRTQITSTGVFDREHSGKFPSEFNEGVSNPLDWVGATKVWNNILVQLALVGVLECVMTVGNADHTATAIAVRDALYVQAFGYNIGVSSLSTACLVAPALPGAPYASRAAAQAAPGLKYAIENDWFYFLSSLTCTDRAASYQPGDNLWAYRTAAMLWFWANGNPSNIQNQLVNAIKGTGGKDAMGFMCALVAQVELLTAAAVQAFAATAKTQLPILDASSNPLKELIAEWNLAHP